MKNKKQHWIPTSYLDAWCDPEVPEGQNKYVWIFSTDGKISKRRGPKNIFYETDMYTIHLSDGTRDLRIENGLCGLEGEFVEIRRNVLAKRGKVTEKERVIVLAMIAAFFTRTRLNREHLKEHWGEVLELMEEMKKFVEYATTAQLNALSAGEPSNEPKLNMADVKIGRRAFTDDSYCIYCYPNRIVFSNESEFSLYPE